MFWLVLAAVTVVLLNTTTTLALGHKILKLPFGLVAGMVASQPAVLSYVSERAQTRLPQIGFTTAVPVSVILKVVYAQILYSVLSRL